jgi:hypothetical protein
MIVLKLIKDVWNCVRNIWETLALGLLLEAWVIVRVLIIVATVALLIVEALWEGTVSYITVLF